ncbi:ThuA domain-containing protein [Paenibacillus sp. TAB 01]|uniref:ThuA domain-containing protein n=1 Tax=Paenibacillus sp. TAB 01 TaxID=3368988 RepID=UPI003753BC47
MRSSNGAIGWPAGEAYPAAWIRHMGKGRLAALRSGHNEASLRSPEMRKLIAAGCTWAAGSSA